MLVHKKRQGSALLTALFIMTLVAIVATAMSTKLQSDIYRTQLMLNHDKLYLASEAVGFWAMHELKDKKKKWLKTTKEGTLAEYPSSLKNIYPSVTLQGAIYDLQARYNLNNLSDKKNLLGFVNFFGAVHSKTNKTTRIKIALAINDWLSPYDPSVGQDPYLAYYLHQKPPYNPSHQLMNNSSELRLVKEVSPAAYLALSPYVVALPEMTTININTAPKAVLLSLNNTLSEKKAQKLIDARAKNGIKKIEKVTELLKELDISDQQITLESYYFLSVAKAQINHSHLVVYRVFKREFTKKKSIKVSLISESFNIF